MINLEKDVIKILVISDIHGNKKLAEKIFEKENFDIAISLGDTELSDNWVNTYFDCAIAGNNDFDSKLQLEKKVILKNFTIFLAHGHTFGSYTTLMNKSSLLQVTSKLKEINLFICGHTHYPLFYPQENNNKAFLNPGSITYPRFGSSYSYAILTININEAKIVNVLFKNPYK